MKSTHHLDPIVLAEWADGRLSPQDIQGIDTHLAVCGECRAEADLALDHFRVEAGRDLGETSARLRRSFQAKLEASPDLAHRGRVDQPIAAPRSPAPRGRRNMTWWLAAAAVAFAGIGIQQMSTTDGPPIPSGEYRSVGAENSEGLEVMRTDDGWSIRSLREDAVGAVRLSVETIDGNVVYQRSGIELEWAIPSAALTAHGEGDLYFVRLSGTDESGRSWRTRAELLP